MNHQDGLALDPEEAKGKRKRDEAAHARPRQRREDYHLEKVQRRRHHHNLAHIGLQHQDPRTQRLQPQHLGRGRPKVVEVLLAKLLRNDGRRRMGRGLCRQAPARGLQARAVQTVARGTPSRRDVARLRQQVRYTGRADGRRDSSNSRSG